MIICIMVRRGEETKDEAAGISREGRYKGPTHKQAASDINPTTTREKTTPIMSIKAIEWRDGKDGDKKTSQAKSRYVRNQHPRSLREDESNEEMVNGLDQMAG